MAEKKKKWIKGATKNAHGQFRKKAEAAGETTRQFAEGHADDSGITGKQARLAKALMGAKKPSSKSMRGKLYGSKE